MTQKLELPMACYIEKPETEETVKVMRGQEGYYVLRDFEKGLSTEELNERISVTDVRILHAMTVGSMFGWDAPGADPNSYDEDLNIKKDV